MSRVSVRFLGSGDALGSGGRFQTCIHVQGGGTSLIIDCGASSLIPIKRYGIDAGRIDAILITHLHGDHFGGIPFFILDAQFSRRTRPLVIGGPPGLRERVVQAMDALFPGLSGVQQRFAVEYLELAEGQETAVGEVVVRPYAVDHASGAAAYALRVVCGGKVIAYSGDTAWTEALVDAAKDADLFICEAYFFDKQVRFHLDYRTLMEHRGELTCRRLMLTHMNADMLGRLDEVSVEVAEDGKLVGV